MSTDSPGSVPSPVPAPTPAPVPDAYWVVPGLLLVGAYPRAARESQVRQLLRALLAAGILVFVDLAPDGERSPYDLLLVEESAGLGVETTYVRFPIPAGGVPPVDVAKRAVATMSRSMSRGRPVYLHDGASTGVAGTLVACWLSDQRAGAEPGRGVGTGTAPEAPDVFGALTPAQRAFVAGWPHV